MKVLSDAGKKMIYNKVSKVGCFWYTAPRIHVSIIKATKETKIWTISLRNSQMGKRRLKWGEGCSCHRSSEEEVRERKREVISFYWTHKQLHNLILITVMWDNKYYPHFINEDIETQRSQVTCWGHRMKWNFNTEISSQSPCFFYLTNNNIIIWGACWGNSLWFLPSLNI